MDAERPEGETCANCRRTYGDHYDDECPSKATVFAPVKATPDHRHEDMTGKGRTPRVLLNSKKGDFVFFEYRGFAVQGIVKYAKKNGIRTVALTWAEKGLEALMCCTIDEDGLWADKQT